MRIFVILSLLLSSQEYGTEIGHTNSTITRHIKEVDYFFEIDSTTLYSTSPVWLKSH